MICPKACHLRQTICETAMGCSNPYTTICHPNSIALIAQLGSQIPSQHDVMGYITTSQDITRYHKHSLKLSKLEPGQFQSFASAPVWPMELGASDIEAPVATWPAESEVFNPFQSVHSARCLIFQSILNICHNSLLVFFSIVSLLILSD